MSIHVSDHALVRWLERTGAFDVEQVREALAASLERCSAAAEGIGSGRYLIVADGLTYVIRDRTLITVCEDRGAHHHARQLRGRGRS